jgi:hypothetical protein
MSVDSNNNNNNNNNAILLSLGYLHNNFFLKNITIFFLSDFDLDFERKPSHKLLVVSLTFVLHLEFSNMASNGHLDLPIFFSTLKIITRIEQSKKLYVNCFNLSGNCSNFEI